MKKNPLLAAFSATWQVIKKAKKLMVLLFMIQLILIVALFSVNVKYQIRALESAQKALGYADQQELTEEGAALNLLQGKSVLGQNPEEIFENYVEFIKAITQLFIYSLVIYTISNGFLWNLTKYSIHTMKFKDIMIYLLKFAAITLIFTVLYGILGYISFKTFFVNFTNSCSGEVMLLAITWLTPAMTRTMTMARSVMVLAMVSLASSMSEVSTAKATIVSCSVSTGR